MTQIGSPCKGFYQWPNDCMRLVVLDDEPGSGTVHVKELLERKRPEFGGASLQELQRELHSKFPCDAQPVYEAPVARTSGPRISGMSASCGGTYPFYTSGAKLLEEVEQFCNGVRSGEPWDPSAWVFLIDCTLGTDAYGGMRVWSQLLSMFQDRLGETKSEGLPFIAIYSQNNMVIEIKSALEMTPAGRRTYRPAMFKAAKDSSLESLADKAVVAHLEQVRLRRIRQADATVLDEVSSAVSGCSLLSAEAASLFLVLPDAPRTDVGRQLLHNLLRSSWMPRLSLLLKEVHQDQTGVFGDALSNWHGRGDRSITHAAQNAKAACTGSGCVLPTGTHFSNYLLGYRQQLQEAGQRVDGRLWSAIKEGTLSSLLATGEYIACQHYINSVLPLEDHLEQERLNPSSSANLCWTFWQDDKWSSKLHGPRWPVIRPLLRVLTGQPSASGCRAVYMLQHKQEGVLSLLMPVLSMSASYHNVDVSRIEAGVRAEFKENSWSGLWQVACGLFHGVVHFIWGAGAQRSMVTLSPAGMAAVEQVDWTYMRDRLRGLVREECLPKLQAEIWDRSIQLYLMFLPDQVRLAGI